ncbi:helix-turn-helix domain-containing protein [Nocardia sp. NPDC003963]
MTTHPHIGEFLKSRRARIAPEQAGLPGTPQRRRVAGLRREELAQLASISVDYYIRIEQGRAEGVSATMLEAISDVLRLNTDERDHLRQLAGTTSSVPPPAAAQLVHDGLRRIMDALDSPAFVLGRRMAILAWNTLACRLITDFSELAPRERNLARLVLIDEKVSRLYPDRELAVNNAVGYLRRDLGRHPDDPELIALIADLEEQSEEFRQTWPLHTVVRKGSGIKQFDHPLAGEFALTYDSVELPGCSDQVLVVYTAEPGSPAAERLALLRSTH